MVGEIRERNVVIDVIKAFAIISVIVGHSIQYGFSDAYLESKAYFDNSIFKIIYSYHMPLFMLISGYLFGFSIDRDWRGIVKKRSWNLLVPIFVWGAIKTIKFIILQVADDDFSVAETCFYFLRKSVLHLWFLWALFLCTILILVVNRLFKDSLLVYISIFAVSFLIPDVMNLGLYKFMYPYFLIGYLYNVKGWQKRVVPYCNIKLLLLLGVIFIILLQFYSYDSYIYTSGHCVWGKDIINQMSINFYRYIIGFIGSCFVILLFYFLIEQRGMHMPFWAYVGKVTMGIYIMESLLLFPEIVKSMHEVNYWVVAIESLYRMTVCLLIINLIKKTKTLNRLLLGVQS